MLVLSGLQNIFWSKEAIEWSCKFVSVPKIIISVHNPGKSTTGLILIFGKISVNFAFALFVWYALGTLLSCYLHVFCWSFLKYISLILSYTFITWIWTQIVNKTVWMYQDYKETEKLPVSAIKVLYHSLLKWETYSSLMFRVHFRETYHPLSPKSETCWREDDCFILVSFKVLFLTWV